MTGINRRVLAAVAVGMAVAWATHAAAMRHVEPFEKPADIYGLNPDIRAAQEPALLEARSYPEAAELHKAPRHFVGSAFPRANDDMVDNPGDWKTVQQKCGMFLHPMGWHHLKSKKRERELPALFPLKWFSLVENINTYNHPKKTIFFNYDQLKKVDPAFKCSAIYCYIGSEQLNRDTEKAAEMFKQFTAPAKKLGIPIFFFFTPLSTRKPEIYEKLSKPFLGKPLWIWFAQYAGASGIAIDFPSGHWLAGGKAWDKYRDLAVSIAKTTKAAGLKFIWCLDGFTKTLEDTRTFATQVKARGVVPDVWLIDQFENKNHVGTPETQATVTGQAKVVLDF